MKNKIYLIILSSLFMGSRLMAQKPTGHTGGGGGNILGVESRTVDERVAALKGNLLVAGHRAKYWLSSSGVEFEAYTLPKDRPSTESGPSIINPEKMSVAFLAHPEVQRTIEYASIVLIEGSCSRDRHAQRDGSANQERIEICFSKESLMKLPLETIDRQLLSLAIHEVAHLVGENEANAEILQKIFDHNPRVSETWAGFQFKLLGALAELKRAAELLALKIESDQETTIGVCYAYGQFGVLQEKFDLIVREPQFELPSHPDNLMQSIDWTTTVNRIWNGNGMCWSDNAKPGEASAKLEPLKRMLQLYSKLSMFIIKYDSPDERLAKEFPYLAK